MDTWPVRCGRELIGLDEVDITLVREVLAKTFESNKSRGFERNGQNRRFPPQRPASPFFSDAKGPHFGPCFLDVAEAFRVLIR